MADETGTGREDDGTSTTYHDVDVAGDRVERLLTEVFTRHWASISAGPVIEGAAYEIRFTAPPTLSMLDGYPHPPRGPRRLLRGGGGHVRPRLVGPAALERPRRADDHGLLPEPMAGGRRRAADRAGVGAPGRLAGSPRPVRAAVLTAAGIRRGAPLSPGGNGA
jgi:hypothetical protein